MSGSLIQAAGTTVTLAGGALAKNIVWQVAGSVNGGHPFGQDPLDLLNWFLPQRPHLDADGVHTQ
jgi:hypothetical protein